MNVEKMGADYWIRKHNAEILIAAKQREEDAILGAVTKDATRNWARETIETWPRNVEPPAPIPTRRDHAMLRAMGIRP